MKLKLGFIAALSTLYPAVVDAQQIPDLDYNPPITSPAYPQNEGPRVSIDEAHHKILFSTNRKAIPKSLLTRLSSRATSLSRSS